MSKWRRIGIGVSGVGLLLIGSLLAMVLWAGVNRPDSSAGSRSNASSSEADRPDDTSEDSQPIPNAPNRVKIRQPDGPPRVATGKTSPLGTPVTVQCATCHATTKAAPDIRSAEELDQFHQGLEYQHGGLACLSCHNPKDYNTLRLANGDLLPFSDVMSLCAQCHGTQARDYRNGSHGGMTGAWDLSQGSRQRNNCIDCHDPHRPNYPELMPVFEPKPPRTAPSPSSSQQRH